MQFLFGDDSNEYANNRDDKYELPTGVILPMKPLPTSNQQYYAEDSYEEILSEESDAEIARADPVYRACSQDARRWIDYIVASVNDHYNDEPHDMISLVYRSFVEAYPTPESISYDAIEYARNPTEYDPREAKHAHLKSIFYSNLVKGRDFRPPSCVAIPDIPGAYLVSMRHDYVYGRAIECALLSRGKVNEIIMRKASDLFQKRRRMIRPCISDHIKSEKLCPSEWVLYVSVTSEFYQYCSDRLKYKNPMIDHGLTAGYVDAEVLSFYLVLFLCGELIEPTRDFSHISLSTTDGGDGSFTSAYYANVNKWKKLPVWLLDIWYTGHPV